MWSLLLYLLFGVGQPTADQPAAGNPTTLSVDDNDMPIDSDGGDKVNVRPPRK